MSEQNLKASVRSTNHTGGPARITMGNERIKEHETISDQNRQQAA